MSVLGRTGDEFDVQIFQDLHLYIQKEVTSYGKLLLLYYKEYDVVFNRYINTIKNLYSYYEDAGYWIFFICYYPLPYSFAHLLYFSRSCSFTALSIDSNEFSKSPMVSSRVLSL